MNYTEEQLQKRFNELPEDVKIIIADAATEEKILEIGRRHHLHIDQLGQLADETGLVLLGFSRPQEFMAHLMTRLNIDQASAGALVNDLNSEIFNEIQTQLKELSEKKGDFFEEKLSKMFTLPKDNSLIIKPYPPAEQPVGPQGQAVPGIDAPKPVIDDPYLEKI